MSAPAAPTDEVWPVWTDFVDNWRAVDAHWFRDRVVNLFDNAAARLASGINGAALPGSLSFLQDVNSLEFFKGGTAWESVRYPNLSVTSDSTSVLLRQTAAGSGVQLINDGTARIDKLNGGAGVLLVDTTGVSIKTGAKTVKMTTDAAQLLVDSPVSITGALAASGAISGASAALTAGLTAASATLTGTLSAGTVNGTSGTIGGVGIASNRVTASDGALFNGGRFYGQGANAMMQANGGGPYLQVTTGGAAYGGGGQFDFYANARFLNNTYPVYYYASNAGAVNIAPSFYSGGDPGAGNFPDGTIWIS